MEWVFLSVVLVLFVFHRTFRHIIWHLAVLAACGLACALLNDVRLPSYATIQGFHPSLLQMVALWIQASFWHALLLTLGGYVTLIWLPRLLLVLLLVALEAPTPPATASGRPPVFRPQPVVSDEPAPREPDWIDRLPPV